MAAVQLIQKTDTGFRFFRLDRIYEIKATQRHGTQLKVTVQATRAEQPARLALATIDLYAHRSRQWFVELCATRLEVDAHTIEDDLFALLHHLEDQAAAKPKPTNIELTNLERQQAQALLSDDDLEGRIVRDLEAVGYVGEETNKLLAYLVATSRKLDRPLSLLIESRSGAGKSALQDAVAKLMPEEETLKYNRITDQALFYQAKDGLEGKLLVIEEAAGMGGAVYSVRALQSGEELRVAATGKDPQTGQLKTQEYTVKARTAVMMTTTQTDFDEETQSRFISTTINETPELTRAVLAMQRQADTVEGIARGKHAAKIAAIHQNAQRLLQSILVANPYAPKLTFPTASLTARRDNKKYLQLIKAVTLLHQHGREKKHKDLDGETFEYIESTVADIAIANRIAKAVLAAHSNDITPQGRLLFGLIRDMLRKKSNGHAATTFTRRELRESCGWSDWQVRQHLDELVELEYVLIKQGRYGQQYTYELSDGRALESLPGFGLTDPEALAFSLDAGSVKSGDLAVNARNLAVKPPNLVAKSGNLAVQTANLAVP